MSTRDPMSENQTTEPESSGASACSPRDESRLAAIWTRQKEEVQYWLNEWMNGCGAKNVSIHDIDRHEMGFTVIFDMDDKSAVIIETDTMSPSVEGSHKYMILDEPVLRKLAEIFNQANDQV